ncbi:hypothetical protein [Xenorhabdus ehlersii]|uniref:Uncharacterized protein n=1 Tax=Xenorhabdus ehlersii TaxID=290111 RepID=A0A2D0IS25_9GAMM|nr:hypothetical protein [Xenorhabdus ehlersii]PHM24695.1 hypothetical protein Xehl_01945 [Xenorhabdus ehlersii]RKE91333.1 hypothetical protein BDE27_1550 [Xenorhabdus ehlersii]
MKLLFSTVLTILSLIIQPALAWQDYNISFMSQKSSKSLNVPLKPIADNVYYFSRINDSCIAKPGPLNFKLGQSSKLDIPVQDINSSTTCVGRQKKIIWAVSTKNDPASLDLNACLLQWSVTLYWTIPVAPQWHTAVTSTCKDFIINATCPDQNCYNYCPDLNNCSMGNTQHVGGFETDRINIVFEEKENTKL